MIVRLIVRVVLLQLMPLRMHDHGWKLQRKLARTAMSLDAVKKYHPLLEDVAAMLCESLRVDPGTFTHHIRLYVPLHLLIIFLTTVL